MKNLDKLIFFTIKLSDDFFTHKEALISCASSESQKKEIQKTIKRIDKFVLDLVERETTGSFDKYAWRMTLRQFTNADHKARADDNVDHQHAEITERITAVDRKKAHRYSRSMLPKEKIFSDDFHKALVLMDKQLSELNIPRGDILLKAQRSDMKTTSKQMQNILKYSRNLTIHDKDPAATQRQ